MSLRKRLERIENIAHPPDKTIHLVWGIQDEPDLYEVSKPGEPSDQKMTRAEVMETITSGTLIFVDYEKRETMRARW